jgi:hypothetical protein
MGKPEGSLNECAALFNRVRAERYLSEQTMKEVADEPAYLHIAPP